VAVQSVIAPERAQSLNGTPFWLRMDEVPVYAVLHSPAPARRKNTAVLILPPFGWEEVCSYRSRRHWAIELAHAGFPAARIDLPGTGDSGGAASDAGVLDRWDLAARTAVDWLRGLAGITRVAAIGIRLGGLLAVRALAGGTQVDDLVLWGVPARGRAYLRELRIQSAVVAIGCTEEHDGRTHSDGTLSLTGFVVNPATVAALEAVDLATQPLPDLSGRRALLIERDGLGVDRTLAAALSGAGAQTRTLPADDYRLLMTAPLELGTPRESIAKTIDWLSAAAGLADSSYEAARSWAEAVEETTMVVNDVRLTERLLGYAGRAGRMVGVLTRPADHEPLLPVCIVLLAPGRRVGPNRMWVETARRWAALGVQSVRFDIEGLGDSDGDGDLMTVEADLYAPRMTENVKELLDRLTELGIADRFVMVGLCSSAYWSFRAAIDEPRIIGATLVNQWSFDVNEALVADRARARSRTRASEALRKGMLKRMVEGVWHGSIHVSDLQRAFGGVRRLAQPAGSAEAAQHGPVQTWLPTLTANGTDVAMIFSMHEPLYEQIVRFGYDDRRADWPNLFIERMPVRDHEIRAPWAQALISDRIDAAIRRQLAFATGPDG
jgi:pimeloyl-ACP methyl ester carboxylesterase